MIGIVTVFIGAVIVLFLGLSKSENSIKPLSVLFLIASSILSFLDAFHILNFSQLSKWAPDGMLSFSHADKLLSMGGEMQFVGLLSFLAASIIIVFPGLTKKGTDQLALMMFSLTGAFMMIGAQNLVMLFLGIEVLSIPLYVLAGSDKDNLFSNESALKYFLMGAFSTAIFLLGCAFIYGGTGTLEFAEFDLRMSLLQHVAEFPILVKIGLILISSGLLFKVSAFPFHFWAPDVYQGSPNRITTFMAVIVKIAGFFAFGQFVYSFKVMSDWFNHWLIVLAVITILVGNIAALSQKSFKRTLAYSSIAHAGYMMLFLITPVQANNWILFAYSVAYGLSSIVLFYFNDKYSTENETGFSMFTGLFESNRNAAILLIISLFSIAGIPISVGFTAKYYLFTAAFSVSPLAVCIALVGSAISIMFYFRAFKPMFEIASENNNSENTKSISPMIYILAIASILLSIFPYLFERAFLF